MDMQLHTRPTSDVLIIGGGTAALRAAVAASLAGAAVTVLRKGPANIGIVAMCAAIPGTDDSVEKYFNDIMLCGKFIADPALAAILAEDAFKEVRFFESQGLSFCHDGSYSPRLTSGNSTPRTIYTNDRTGPEMLVCLQRILRQNRVSIMNNRRAVRLLRDDSRVLGALAVNRLTWELEVYPAKAVILASGGLGRFYSGSNNHPHLSGDGYALAFQAGVELADMEFVQFEPFNIRTEKADDVFGISFLLGDDPRITNKLGQEFLPDRAVRLGKDVLSRKIFEQIRERKALPHDGVWFDVTHVPIERLELHERFLGYCRRVGIDPAREPFEAGPSQHYMLGGVCMDSRTATALPGLFVAGEVATGVHGADRIGGNSATDVLVFGARAGRSAVEYAKAAEVSRSEPPIRRTQVQSLEKPGCSLLAGPDDLQEIGTELRRLLYNNVGIIRNEAALQQALARIREWRAFFGARRAERLPIQLDLMDMENRLQLAEMMCIGAVQRKESRGVHYREDYPARNDSTSLRRTSFRMVDGDISWRSISLKWTADQESKS